VRRTDIPAGWDERTTLTTFLDYVRAKCEHLAEADARRAPLPGSPLMTLAGLVNHLRWVEYFWLQVMLLGEEDHGPWTEEDPDREMRIAVAEISSSDPCKQRRIVFSHIRGMMP